LAGTTISDRWLWYAIRTPRCVPLDHSAYQSTIFNRETIPWPDWCCKAPDGGVHIDARVGAIDVHLSQAPRGPDELAWTCNYQVLIASKAWLAQIEDLIDGQKVALGQILVNGRASTDWATINEALAPGFFSSEGRSKICPICGSVYATLWGKAFFTDPDVAGRPLIIASSGIFVREDEAIRRALRTPTGAYKPTLVRLRRGRRQRIERSHQRLPETKRDGIP
jgi:hypothetical protein